MVETKHNDLAEKVTAFFRHDPSVQSWLARVVRDGPNEKPSDVFLERLSHSTIKIIDNNPAIRRWMESLPEDELGGAIMFTLKRFTPGFKEVHKAKQEHILACQRDRRDFQRGFALIAKGMEIILALESLSPDMRHKLKASYDSLNHELDTAGERIYSTKGFRASLGGWRQYAEFILNAAESTKTRFSVPLVLNPADLLRIVKATYGDLVSEKNLEDFFASRKGR